MRNLIKAVLAEWKERKLPEIIDREINLYSYAKSAVPKIIAVTGFRRVGKTYMMLHLVKALLARKTREGVVYLNFEDERLPLKTELLTLLLPTIREVYRQKTEFLFLDEIQGIPQWSKWVRRIYDSEGVRIFISGSSSKMSSREIPTELRGRFIEVKVFPLSFKEFLSFNNLEFDFKTIEHSKNKKAELLNALNEYLEYGGFPEIVLSGEERKVEIAQSYYQTLVRRDIIERFKLKNEEGLKALLRLLLGSTKYSISKLYNTLKSLNYDIGKGTLQRYISHIEDSFFMFSVPVFSYKVKDQMQYPRKPYFIDTVFISKISTKFTKAYGRLYENLVAVELKRRDKEFYYWEGNHEEVDFVVKDGLKTKQLIQVCYDASNPEIKKRELRALLKASRELKCRNLIIITEDEECQRDAAWFGIKRRVKFQPLWKWLVA
ncbi:AAA family ATPase [Candidatus Woesearchaeota archaeon CG08_land_8_20_14_0_20_47_9]|nr:MAG: AAA family ATPase [Candidatus Woesearchaeota archaeon CG1_02_47_18]PIO03244.1 MAG: AAA family ATPase [Candidatus Woesearchaeota archaeon CG08_land_8_20_14_0_20_47_9]HII30254.1 ATP-binding protein [Candidatus Woesearchaeota archaeon]